MSTTMPGARRSESLPGGTALKSAVGQNRPVDHRKRTEWTTRKVNLQEVKVPVFYMF